MTPCRSGEFISITLAQSLRLYAVYGPIWSDYNKSIIIVQNLMMLIDRKHNVYLTKAIHCITIIIVIQWMAIVLYP